MKLYVPLCVPTDKGTTHRLNLHVCPASYGTELRHATPDVQTALVTLQTARGDAPRPEQAVLFSERGGGLSPATVRLWFHRLYTSLHMDGCSSHSGRRTFITRAARKVSQVGGSLRDVQELAGHTSLAMTQRYIEGDTEAKRKLVALL